MAEIIGNNFIKLASVDSTNNYATKYVSKSNWSEGTIICSDVQLEGRGQVNNSWESEAGKNLLLSVILYPEFLPVQSQFMLSKVVALSVAELVALYVDDVFVKWPNDIYVSDKKIAGILIENSIMGMTIGWSIAGIGLNVNQQKFFSNAPNPISLYQLMGSEFDLNEVRKLLQEYLEKWYLMLVNGDTERIDRFYRSRLYQHGIWAKYRDKDGVLEGRITGVNEIGQLQISDRNELTRTYHFKEVSFL